MADIFISYSKSDHALTLKLAAFLEAEGWSVWWDKSLSAADLYRDEIMKQLAAARAVITIWSPSSIKSDWVRAEAGRAKAEGKLIPVKTFELTYADIPLPFGEMHTENISSTDLIRAAVVAQLSKPETSASQVWQFSKILEVQVLTWIGIVGSAITVFGGVSTILDLADWARVLVQNWHEWNHMVWAWVFTLIKVKVPKEFVPIISFTVFTAMLVVGVNLNFRIGQKPANSENTTKLTRTVRIFGVGVLLYLVTIVAMFAILLLPSIISLADTESQNVTIYVYLLLLETCIGFPVAYLLYRGNQRSLIFLDSLLLLFMYVLLLSVPLWILEKGGDTVSLVVSSYLALKLSDLSLFMLLPVCWMAVILFSPLQQLTRRLAFVMVGVLTLVVLSEISKLNLHQYLQPPKASQNYSLTITYMRTYNQG
jgi:hypothetical protein